MLASLPIRFGGLGLYLAVDAYTLFWLLGCSLGCYKPTISYF